jgi:dolichyl-phosphate beta-glucosyltransferase
LTPFLSIIIPAHNEAHRLPATLARVMEFLDSQTYSTEVLVVENASQDQTAEIAEQYAQRYPAIRVLKENRAGKGLAVRRGMMEAAGQFRFICDADLSMPIEEVNKFLPPQLDNFDIAIASREIPGSKRYNEPFYRHFIGRVFNFLVRSLTIPGLQDTQCGFKCFSGNAAEILFPLQTIDGWTFDVEILFIAQHHDYRIVEVPIQWYYFTGSRVNLIRDSVQMLLDLFRIRRNWRRGVYQQS